MTISEAARFLRERDGFLILTHMRPDGDTEGSAAALCHALRSLGKVAFLYDNPQFADYMPWITADYLAPQGFAGAFVVAVDTASRGLLPKGFEGEVDLAIDHHPSNTGFAKETVLDSTKASCGEVILEIVRELAGGVEQAVADLLYIAVSTDTGCFVYGNTTGATLRAAADLVDAGASNKALNKILFRTSTKARIALEGEIYASLRYYHGGETAFAFVTREMIERTLATENDCADIAALPGRVEGVTTSAVLRECGDRRWKVSLRTNGAVNASRVCAGFGGGGHVMAAGCDIDGTADEVAALLERAIAEDAK